MNEMMTRTSEACFLCASVEMMAPACIGAPEEVTDCRSETLNTARSGCLSLTYTYLPPHIPTERTAIYVFTPTPIHETTV